MRFFGGGLLVGVIYDATIYWLDFDIYSTT